MFARIMSADLKKETIDQAATECALISHPSRTLACGRVMLVDRASGKYLSITIWESEAAQRRDAASPGQIAGRTAMTQKYFVGPPTPATYDVVAAIE